MYGERNGNPLQCSCLENPRDGGAWWAAVYGVAQSRTRLKRLSSSTLLYMVEGYTYRTQKPRKTLWAGGGRFTQHSQPPKRFHTENLVTWNSQWSLQSGTLRASTSHGFRRCPIYCDLFLIPLSYLRPYRALSTFSSVQSLSRVQLFSTPWTAACQASLSITNSQSLLKLMSIESVMPSNHLILCCPLLLPSIFPSIRVFSNESVLQIRQPKYCSFSISPSSE